MSQLGVHHIGITTGHFAETARLYQEGLGFTIKHIWGRDKKVYMMETGDGACVELFEGEPGLDEGGGSHGNGQWMHLALRSNDIQADYQRALDAGFKEKLPPTYADILEAEPEPVYMWFAYLIGYDGEEVELIQELEGPVPQ